MTEAELDSGRSPDLTGGDLAFYSLVGVMRFNAEAVADALRAGTLSPFAIECLAKLIDGTHSGGLRLSLKGQGKGWKPIYETAQAYDRLMEIGRFCEERRTSGCSYEEALLDAAEKFGISEATVARDWRLYRLSQSPEI